VASPRVTQPATVSNSFLPAQVSVVSHSRPRTDYYVFRLTISVQNFAFRTARRSAFEIPDRQVMIEQIAVGRLAMAHNSMIVAT
jgi:hypothetical protein